MLRQRFYVAIILAPFALVAAWVGGWLVFALIAAVSILATSEMLALGRGKGHDGVLVYVGLLALLTGVMIAGERALGPAITWFTIALVLQQLLRRSAADLMAIMWPLFTWCYIGILASHMWLLRGLVDGRFYLLFAFLTTWAFDSVAFFVGRRYGRTRFCPEISPKKSVQGFAAGMAAAVVIAVALALVPGSVMIPGGITLSRAVLLGIACALAAQTGDLAASLIKRSAGVKDSGRLLPGHGGVLDRIDSVLFVVPILYYLVA